MRSGMEKDKCFVLCRTAKVEAETEEIQVAYFLICLLFGELSSCELADEVSHARVLKNFEMFLSITVECHYYLGSEFGSISISWIKLES